jgi:hypothetical protein
LNIIPICGHCIQISIRSVPFAFCIFELDLKLGLICFTLQNHSSYGFSFKVIFNYSSGVNPVCSLHPYFSLILTAHYNHQLERWSALCNHDFGPNVIAWLFSRSSLPDEQSYGWIGIPKLLLLVTFQGIFRSCKSF